MSTYVVRAAEAGDDESIRRLLGAPQPSALLALGFERSPSYWQAAHVSHVEPDIIVAEHCATAEVVAVVNMGSRPIFVNGTRHNVRFGSDLRVAPEHQGGRLLLYINRVLKKTLGDKGWYQTIILSENERSRAVFAQGGRAGIPFYTQNASVSTFTVTGQKAETASTLTVRTATPDDVPAMNAFAQQMATYYQFLPAYDFAGVQCGDSYFRGLSLQDFVLVERAGQLCALGAVWNQKSFKQTRVMAYQPLIRIVRPFYNAWNYLRGGLHLPPTGGLLDYRLAHSPLCAPTDAEAFSTLLQALWQRCRQQGGRALSFSLAGRDPRQTVLKQFRCFTLTGIHYLATFCEGSLPELDESLIPYFECGRL